LDKALLALAGPGTVVYAPAKLAAEDRTALTRALEDLFGTPAAPRVPEDLPAEKLASLGLGPGQLAVAAKLYKQHCVQCHGMAGDGRGPTGLWVYPHPRDFRQGVYKFTSTPGRTPMLEDLVRVIRTGIAGNSMPAFTLLGGYEHNLLAQYVVYLSVRGRVEYDVLKALFGEELGEPIPAYARQRAAIALGTWADAQSAYAPLPDAPDLDEPGRVRNGWALYTGVGGCASCHADYGRKEQYRYDVFGVAVRPTNLTLGDFRGGKEPADLFCRIRFGIAASGMPGQPALTVDQVWDLAAFIRALPVPRQLPEDIRAKVYPDVK
jgi:mono/diheme cytochrome c family protein